MQLEQTETFAVHGPQLEVLGNAETALPAPARKKPTAALVLAVLAFISVFGIGGVKLKGKYNDVKALYTAADSYGNTTQTDFEVMADSAANMIRLCGKQLGTDNASVQAAQTALDNWNAAASESTSPATQYTQGQALYTALEELYSTARTELKEKDAKAWSEISGQHDNATSAWAAIMSSDTPAYNTAASSYNKTAQGLPAAMIGGLWGCGQLEIFG